MTDLSRSQTEVQAGSDCVRCLRISLQKKYTFFKLSRPKQPGSPVITIDGIVFRGWAHTLCRAEFTLNGLASGRDVSNIAGAVIPSSLDLAKKIAIPANIYPFCFHSLFRESKLTESAYWT